MRHTRYVLGVDLGPAAAFTALAVAERVEDDASDDDPTYAVRLLRRFPPGTPYRSVARAVGELLAAEELADAEVAVDVTAVGVGVLDLFREVEARPTVVPVFVTAGHQAEQGTNGAWLVPKKDLVTGLQLLLQGRRLTIPAALPEANLLVRELGNFRARPTLAADPLQAEWREGKDDDLVLAVAVAGWHAGRLPRPYLDYGAEIIWARGRPPYPGGVFPGRYARPWWSW